MKPLLKILVLLVFILQVNSAIASEDISGTWQGTLKPAPGSELVIQFVISKNADGAYSVVLNSPDQGAIKDIKASSVVFDSGKLTLDVTALSGAYEGVLKNGTFEGNWKQEGTLIPLNLKPYVKPVLTREDMAKLAGQWHGELKIPTGTHMLVFRFEMKDDKDFKGFLDLPDSGGSGLPVTDIELTGADVKFKVPNAGAVFKGKLAENALTGELKLNTQPFPLTLEKGEYKAPTHDLKLPEDIKKQLAGEWHGQLKTPRGLMHTEFRFETNKKGELIGFYGVPDQNVKGIPFTEASFKDGKLTLKIKVANAEFTGQIKGDVLSGEWAQAGLSNIALTMKKGEYVPPVFSLDLPKETRDKLMGEWHGMRKMAKGFIRVAFRFETIDKGDFVGFYDLPDQNGTGIPVTEASLSDGQLVLRMQKRMNLEFKGKLAGNELTGEMIQPGTSNTPVSLKKGKYVQPVYSLNLPDATKKLLSGEWFGEVKTPATTATVVFRFETNKKGEFIGTEDIPAQKITGIPVSEANFSDGKLSYVVTNVEYKGELSEGEFTGEVLQEGNNPPIAFTLKKGKYVPPVYSLKLPGDIMKTLSGKWKGKLASYTLIFRFEKNEKGDFLGFIDSPDSHSMDIQINEASYKDGKLNLRVKLANAEFEGKLSGSTLAGEWTQAGQNIPLSLKKQ